MPEVNVDDRNFELYKQCEIRRPSPATILNGEWIVGGQTFHTLHKPAGYYFDIVWVKSDLARKDNNLQDGRGNKWTIHEVYGAKKMPGGRENFKQVVP